MLSVLLAVMKDESMQGACVYLLLVMGIHAMPASILGAVSVCVGSIEICAISFAR